MPSAKKVVSVRLSDQQYEALSRFSVALGESRGHLIAEMVAEMVPVWEKLAQSIEAAKLAQVGAVKGWKEGVLGQLSPMEQEAERLKDDALQLVVGALDAFERAAAAAGGGGVRSATPMAVAAAERPLPPSL
jgi:predicted DNA-binding protein